MKFALISIGVSFMTTVVHAGPIDIKKLPVLSQVAPTSGAKTGLIYLWASWCPDCREKMKGALTEFSKRLGADLFLVNVERDSKRGKDFLASLAINLESYADPEKLLVKELKLFSVPSWAIVKKQNDGRYEVAATGAGSDLSTIEERFKELQP